MRRSNVSFRITEELLLLRLLARANFRFQTIKKTEREERQTNREERQIAEAETERRLSKAFFVAQRRRGDVKKTNLFSLFFSFFLLFV